MSERRWLLRLGEQTLGAAFLVPGLRGREQLGGALQEVDGYVLVLVLVLVLVMRNVGRVVQIDEKGVGGAGLQVQAEHLYPSRERLVALFLFPPPVHFLLVPVRRVVVVVVDVTEDDAGEGGHADSRERHVDVGEAVGLDGVVVEPGAIARLPFEAADHAELGLAPARHVVAAFLELDGGGAVEAALPAFLLCDLDELLRRGVLGALAARVPFVVAGAADFGLAPLASAVLAASVGAAARVDGDVGGFNPRAAALCGAVDAVLGRVFLKFSVPFSFEAVVKELVDVFEADALFCAASGGHVLRVRCREGEDAAEAFVAHVVFAR